MADEADKTKKAQKPEDGDQAKTSSKGGGLIQYIIFGVVGLVAVVGIAFGTLMFLGDDEASEVPADAQVEESKETQTSHADQPTQGDGDETIAHEANAMSFEDSIIAAMEHDESVLEAIMANLEVLDYVPGDEELAAEETGMSAKDSIEAVNWLDSEKTKLAERESALAAREKELKVLDTKVSQKITRIEQAESSRISKLAKLYDGMEARSVAKLIANLDDNTVVALLPRMKLKNASNVLSLMPPIRAARLSKQMITIAEN